MKISFVTALLLVAGASHAQVSLSQFPVCAQACVNKALEASDCDGLRDLECICKGREFNAVVGPCEAQACSHSDLRDTITLAEQICEPVGGLTPIASAVVTSLFPSYYATPTTVVPPAGTGTGVGSPPPEPTADVPPTYPGQAGRQYSTSLSWIEGIMAVVAVMFL